MDGDAPLSPVERQAAPRRMRSELLSREGTPVAGDRPRGAGSFLSPRSSGLLLLSPHANRLLSPRREPGDLFSPPSSPRQRQTTFGATLDFIEVWRRRLQFQSTPKLHCMV